MDSNRIGLVFGYLYNIDYMSKEAKDLGLNKRFAIVVNRYPDEAPGVYDIEFDYKFLLELLKITSVLISHDKVRIMINKGQELGSLSELNDFYADIQEDDREPFVWLKYIKKEEVTCYIEFDPYAYYGGPYPYHDAFVYSFYQKDYDRKEIQKAIISYCVNNDIFISEILLGEWKPRYSFKERVRNFFKSTKSVL